MLRNHLHRLVIAIVAIAAAVLATGHAHAADSPLPNPFTQYSFDASPKNVFMETTKAIWFTFPDDDKLGVLTLTGSQTQTVTPTVAYFSTGAGSKPYDLVVSNGAVWTTLLGSNQIGRLDLATHVLTSYVISTANSEPTGITAGGGYIWFVERKGDNLGRLNPATGAVNEFTDKVSTDRNQVDMTGAELEDVTYSNGGPWFTGPKFRTSVAQFETSTGTFIGAIVGTEAQPMQIWADSVEDVWITAKGFNQIGRSGLNTNKFWQWYNLPAPPAGVDGETAGPVGLFVQEINGRREVWYTRPGINRAGRLITKWDGTNQGTIETDLPTANSAPWGIGAAVDGNVWVAATNAKQAVAWSAPYFYPTAFVYLANIIR
jgi:streptogramin lyase